MTPAQSLTPTRRFVRVTGGALIAALVASAAPAQDAEPLENYDAATVLATVGDREITLGDVIYYRSQVPEQVRTTLSDEQLYDGLIEELVRQAQLANAADAAGLESDASVQRQLETARTQILAQAYIDSTVEPKLTEEALQAHLDTTFAEAPRQDQLRARHILLADEATAKEVKQLIDDGGDFAELAKERSTGPSGRGGGDLDYFSQQEVVPEFWNAAAALEVGGVSDPVQTGFGWHVIKLEDRRTAPPPTLDEVRPQIRQDLANRLAQEAMTALAEETEVSRPDRRPPASAIRQEELLSGGQ